MGKSSLINPPSSSLTALAGARSAISRTCQTTPISSLATVSIKLCTGTHTGAGIQWIEADAPPRMAITPTASNPTPLTTLWSITPLMKGAELSSSVTEATRHLPWGGPSAGTWRPGRACASSRLTPKGTAAGPTISRIPMARGDPSTWSVSAPTKRLNATALTKRTTPEAHAVMRLLKLHLNLIASGNQRLW